MPRPAPLLLLFVTATVLTLGACSRSPKEQLAYEHAELQYQINQRNAERARGGEESATPVEAGSGSGGE
ncbi:MULTISPECIES: hypothetical protein [unclassified Herbaspirillum]|uniref:hypothetical protein n=1 Tax=unclassified Herbaspirillum TaxID=2624150 RepID=UPI001E4CA04C|nr:MULTISPECIES: hypothetical protein [unclassified Herbaspirillum]